MVKAKRRNPRVLTESEVRVRLRAESEAWQRKAEEEAESLERMRQIAEANRVALDASKLETSRLRTEMATMRRAWRNMQMLERLALLSDFRLTAKDHEGWRTTAQIAPLIGGGNPVPLDTLAEWFSVEP